MRTKHTIERVVGNLAGYWSLGVCARVKFVRRRKKK